MTVTDRTFSGPYKICRFTSTIDQMKKQPDEAENLLSARKLKKK